MAAETPLTLSAAGLQAIRSCREEAVSHAEQAFYGVHGRAYDRFGEAGRRACREDLGFHLDFLEPALEFGNAEPFGDYLCWLKSVLDARTIPAGHLMFSVELLVQFLSFRLDAQDRNVLREIVTAAGKFLESPTAACGSRRVDEEEIGLRSGMDCAALTAALLAGDRRLAMKVLESTGAGGDLHDRRSRMIQYAMYDIGDAWQENRVSVAQEHLATATAHTLLAQMTDVQEPFPASGKRILLACVEGNHHALGLRMVADSFERAGWTVLFLGANVPARSIVGMAQKERPDVVGISAALPQHLRAARETVGALRLALGTTTPPVLLGGQAVNRFSGIANAARADMTLKNSVACKAFARGESSA